MKNNSINGFVRLVFWTLIIGSFGWTTLVGIGAFKVIASNDKTREVEDRTLEIRLSQKIERNQQKIEENQEKVLEKFEDMRKEVAANQIELLKEIKKIQ